MPINHPWLQFDAHLARFLLLLLIFTVIITGGEILGQIFWAAILAVITQSLYAALQAFWQGYGEAKVGRAES